MSPIKFRLLMTVSHVVLPRWPQEQDWVFRAWCKVQREKFA